LAFTSTGPKLQAKNGPTRTSVRSELPLRNSGKKTTPEIQSSLICWVTLPPMPAVHLPMEGAIGSLSSADAEVNPSVSGDNSAEVRIRAGITPSLLKTVFGPDERRQKHGAHHPARIALDFGRSRHLPI
jgi:hypothetical protein